VTLQPRERPHPPPPYDVSLIDPVNQSWDLLAGGRPGEELQGWRARAAGFVWTLLGPVIERQRQFNAHLVDHLNRNVKHHEGTRDAQATTIAMLGEQHDVLFARQTLLMAYLQRLTPYVDSKDLEAAGLLRRINEDCRELIDILEHRAVALAGGIGGVSDELQKRLESLAARERRYEARVSTVAADQQRSTAEFQTSLAGIQRATQGLKRELERLATAGGRAASAAGPGADSTPAVVPAAAAGAGQLAASSLDSHKYVGFEDQFRGSQTDIRKRVEEYVPYFEGAADVLDLGCGRGEFLEVLREGGITARGLDINHEMVEVCLSHGLDVAEGDALTYLRSLPDGSLGGLFSAQVVEHLQPDYLLQLLDEAWRTLRPGSRIILETINPACWVAFFESYIRDITHVRPLHPDTLKYLLIASGFLDVEVRFRAPYPDDGKLQTVPALPPAASAAAEGLTEIAETVNANARRLNQLLFTHLDYAAIGTKA
jgi:SAM-dependent methyltransferase